MCCESIYRSVRPYSSILHICEEYECENEHVHSTLSTHWLCQLLFCPVAIRCELAHVKTYITPTRLDEGLDLHFRCRLKLSTAVLDCVRPSNKLSQLKLFLSGMQKDNACTNHA